MDASQWTKKHFSFFLLFWQWLVLLSPCSLWLFDPQKEK
jgi:hypothetical protein